MSFLSTLEEAGTYEQSADQEQMKIEFEILNSMYRLLLPMSTAPHMREASCAAAKRKDGDLTEHSEFNWCLRSPLEGRLLMHTGTQDHYDVLETRCEERTGIEEQAADQET